VTSADVGRFIFIDTAKPAIWAGVAVPDMIFSIAQVAWPLSRSFFVVSRPSMSDQVGESPAGSDRGCVEATARWCHAHGVTQHEWATL
jgi:hypothetical protein